MMEPDQRDALDAFRDSVNMAPKTLEDWLETSQSKAAGFKGDDGRESVGHASGCRIVELPRTKQDDYTASDFDHMRKVVGYIHRHLAQRPDGDVTDTLLRFSLMNWGHDPKRAQ